MDPEGWNYRAACFYDASGHAAGESPESLAALLGDLGLETGDFCRAPPGAMRGVLRFPGPPATTDLVLMVLRKNSAFERAGVARLESGREAQEVARAAGAEWYHPPSRDAPGFLLGGTPWDYPRAPALHHLLQASSIQAPWGEVCSRGRHTPRPLYAPLFDPRFQDPRLLWGRPPPPQAPTHFREMW